MKKILSGTHLAIPSNGRLNHKEVHMKCPKCSGLMYIERLSDFFVVFHVWKCINCGALIDKTILNNQKKNLEVLEPVETAAK